MISERCSALGRTRQELGDTSRPIQSRGADGCRQLVLPVCRAEQPGEPAGQARRGLGESWLWQEHSESRGRREVAVLGREHGAFPLNLCWGETEAPHTSKRSHWCPWHSAHVCCAHTGLCALCSSQTIPKEQRVTPPLRWDVGSATSSGAASISRGKPRAQRARPGFVTIAATGPRWLWPQPHWRLHLLAPHQLQTCCGGC